MAAESQQTIRYTVELDLAGAAKQMRDALGGGQTGTPFTGGSSEPSSSGGGGGNASDQLKVIALLTQIEANTHGGGTGGGGGGGGSGGNMPVSPVEQAKQAEDGLKRFTDTALQVANVIRTGVGIGGAMVDYSGNMLAAGQNGVMSGNYLSQRAQESAARAGAVSGVGGALGGGIGAIIGGGLGGPLGMAAGSAIGGAIGQIPGQIMEIGAKLDAISANTYAFTSGLERYSGTIMAANLHAQYSAIQGQQIVAGITAETFGRLEPLQSKLARINAVAAGYEAEGVNLETERNAPRDTMAAERSALRAALRNSIQGEMGTTSILGDTSLGRGLRQQNIEENTAAFSSILAEFQSGKLSEKELRGMEGQRGGIFGTSDPLTKANIEALIEAKNQLNWAKGESINSQTDLIMGLRAMSGTNTMGGVLHYGGEHATPWSASGGLSQIAGPMGGGAFIPHGGAVRAPQMADFAQDPESIANAMLGIYSHRPGETAERRFFGSTSGGRGIPKPQQAAINFNQSDYFNIEANDFDAIRSMLDQRTNTLMDKMYRQADINFTIRASAVDSVFSRIR